MNPTISLKITPIICLYLLGSKTKENTPIISFSWEKQWGFVADFDYCLYVFYSRDVRAKNYYHTHS
jgi:hypothetical protein